MLGAVALVVLFFVAIFGLASPYPDASPRAKVTEATNMSNPARTAVGIACSEGTLASGMSNEQFDLASPEEYGQNTETVQSVTVAVDDNQVATVTIVLGDIYRDARFWRTKVFEPGYVVEYRGVCADQVVRWSVSGTLPQKYLPRY